MNALHVLRPARKILTATVVTVVAATALGSATTNVAASAGHHRADVSQATKEWKSAPVTKDVAIATKEYKVVLPSPNKTKEW